MLRGGGWITWVMARSTRESYRMTSRQYTRMRRAAASRTPSLPRRRRWPPPTGANMAERQPRRSCCSAGEQVLSSVTCSAMPLRKRSGGENLGLLALELVGRDDAAVTQVGQLGQLVGRVLRTRGVLDVATELLVPLLRVLHGPLLHRAAAGDQVDQDADQRDEQHEQEPQGLRPAGQVMAAEDVDEDVDQDPDPEHPEEDLEDRPECPEQRVGVRTGECHGDLIIGTALARRYGDGPSITVIVAPRGAPPPRPARVIGVYPDTVTFAPASRSQPPVVAVACTTAVASGA